MRPVCFETVYYLLEYRYHGMVQVERVSPKVPTVLVYCNRVLYRCVPCASRLPPVSYPVSLRL